MTSNAAARQYMIYLFEKPVPANGNAHTRPRWALHGTLDTLAEARSQTEDLFASGRYQKVEIKQKCFDARRQRHVDVSLKVVEERQPAPRGAYAVLAAAFLCGAVLAAALLLSH